MLILEFVIGLAVLVIVHEMGHFVACRIFKIPVDEFGIGFPPRIATLFEWGGTKFSLNAIPLGGFVRPRGESDPELVNGLMAATPWKRIGVYFAGPFMNLLVAVILYTVIIMRLGALDTERMDEVMITYVEPGSPAETAGIVQGDIITRADGVAIQSSEALRDVVYSHLDEAISIEYRRGDETFTTTLTPRSNPPEGQAPIGIAMGVPTRSVGLLEAVPAGAVATYEHGKALLSMLTNFVTGRDTGEGELLGIKGMVETYSDIREGTSPSALPVEVDVMGFFTSLTVSLGMLNLLPIPALDGGRILLALPEIIMRRRIPTRYQEILIGVTFILLLGLLILVNVMEFF
jgi:regulator of sigma E protease